MLFLLLVPLAIHPATLIDARPPTPGLGEGFCHTRGNQILDSANRPVRIAGVNWYGFETTQSAPGGLEVQDIPAKLLPRPSVHPIQRQVT